MSDTSRRDILLNLHAIDGILPPPAGRGTFALGGNSIRQDKLGGAAHPRVTVRHLLPASRKLEPEADNSCLPALKVYIAAAL